ncbi:MAG: winged helix-turn-helix domain-containing protein, partial [Dactylosporangium sp.]|nr:winged helix-turn-helix domain-containing protein [Dactylosporangium sp.]
MLGPVEVRDGDRVLPLPAARVSALLVTLLLRANRVVTVDELVDRVWGEHPPGNPRAALQTTVQRLRRALGDETLIRTRPRGYLIELEPRRLDLLLFRDLVEQAHRVGDLIRRRDLLGQALALWRGPPLAGMTAEPLLRDEVPRLVEERLAAQELWTDVRLDLGEHARLIPELVALTREHPLRERAWGQLMLALYRA